MEGVLEAAKRGEQNFQRLSRSLGVPPQFGKPTEIEFIEAEVKETREQLLEPPASFCCVCLAESQSLVASPTLTSAFTQLIGSLPFEIEAKFCSSCSECLEGFNLFRQTSLESVGFLAKISSIETIDVKIEDLIKVEDEKSEDCEEAPLKKRSPKKTKKGPREFYCGICHKRLKGLIMTHVFGTHFNALEDGSFQCLTCNRVASSKSSAKFHFESHNETLKELTCKVCGASFRKRNTYNQHCSKHLTYECHNCGRKLSTKTRLKEHMLTQHSDAKRCSYCTTIFFTAEEYTAHMQLEREKRIKRNIEKPVCDICGFIASCGPALSTHKARLHSNSEVVCDMCGKSSRNRHQHLWHIRQYHEEKRFECPTCGKKFSVNSQLNKHIRISHDKSGSVPCDVCGKVFTLLNSMKKHKATVHSNVYKHECKLCGRAFKVKALLVKHQFSHLNKKPYNCHLCSTGYYMVDYLKSHYLKIHDLNFSSKEVNDFCIRVHIDKSSI